MERQMKLLVIFRVPERLTADASENFQIGIDEMENGVKSSETLQSWTRGKAVNPCYLMYMETETRRNASVATVCSSNVRKRRV